MGRLKGTYMTDESKKAENEKDQRARVTSARMHFLKAAGYIIIAFSGAMTAGMAPLAGASGLLFSGAGLVLVFFGIRGAALSYGQGLSVSMASEDILGLISGAQAGYGAGEDEALSRKELKGSYDAMRSTPMFFSDVRNIPRFK